MAGLSFKYMPRREPVFFYMLRCSVPPQQAKRAKKKKRDCREKITFLAGKDQKGDSFRNSRPQGNVSI